MHTVINKTKRILKKPCIMKLAALQVFKHTIIQKMVLDAN